MKKFLLFPLIALTLLGTAQNATKTNAQQKFPIKPRILPEKEIINQQTKNTKAAILSEDFEVWPPVGWTIIDGLIGSGHWQQSFDDDCGNGTGQALVPFGNNQDEVLITPEISIPATGQYRLTFQWVMNFERMVDSLDNGDLLIEISINGGTTWAPLWNEDEQLFVESPVTPWPWQNCHYYTSQINLSDFTGTNIKLALHYTASEADKIYIDNFSIASVPENELVLSRPIISFLPGGGFLSRQPYTQTSEIFFGADIWNNGANNSGNVLLDALVTLDGDTIYHQQKDTFNIFAGSCESIGIDETYFEEYIDYYSVEYLLQLRIQHDSIEIDTFNNYFEIEHEISGYSFSRWTDYTTAVGPKDFSGANDGDFIGVRYYIPTDASANGLRIFIDNETNEGTTIFGKIFKETESGILYVCETDEYTITLADIENGWLFLDFYDVTGYDLCLEGNTNYFVGLECWSGTEKILIGADNIGAPHNYMYESVLRQGTDNWYYFNSVPMIELYIDDYYWDCPTRVANFPINDISISPNPTEGVINFTNVAKSNITVYNILGEVVAQVNNANDLTTIDLSKFDNGTYTVKIENNSKVVIKKVVLSK